MIDKEFENKCKTVFGCSSKHLLYKITDIETRLEAVEKFISTNGPLIASIILRIEAITSSVGSIFKRDDFRSAVDKETDVMFVKNNNLIEKK